MSCDNSDGHGPTGATTGDPAAAGATTVYSVTGMSCSHCEKAVTEAVSALAGVTGVRVDVAAGRVTVTSTGELDDALVREAVDEAGYELAGRVETATGIRP